MNNHNISIHDFYRILYTFLTRYVSTKVMLACKFCTILLHCNIFILNY